MKKIMNKKKQRRYLILIVIISLNSFSQVTLNKENRIMIPVELYKTTKDFFNNKLWAGDYKAVLKNKLTDTKIIDSIKKHGDTIRINTKVLSVREFLTSKTDNKLKRGMKSWIIRYNNCNYFNLGYSVDMNSWNNFIKLDLVGRYCLYFISSESDVDNISNNQFGLGLTGVIVNSLMNPKTYYKDKENKKYSIYYIDTNELHSSGFGKNSIKVSISFSLTKRRFLKILKKHNLDINNMELSFENIIESFEKINKTTMPNKV